MPRYRRIEPALHAGRVKALGRSILGVTERQWEVFECQAAIDLMPDLGLPIHGNVAQLQTRDSVRDQNAPTDRGGELINLMKSICYFGMTARLGI